MAWLALYDELTGVYGNPDVPIAGLNQFIGVSVLV
jgi:hypothetical protein